MCAQIEIDDKYDLRSLSYVIKLGFELKRLISAKKGLAIRNKDAEANMYK